MNMSRTGRDPYIGKIAFYKSTGPVCLLPGIMCYQNEETMSQVMKFQDQVCWLLIESLDDTYTFEDDMYVQVTSKVSCSKRYPYGPYLYIYIFI